MVWVSGTAPESNVYKTFALLLCYTHVHDTGFEPMAFLV